MNEPNRLVDELLNAPNWLHMRSGNSSTAMQVRDDLRTLLFSGDPSAVNAAYGRIENPVVAQGNLYQCAPAVVSVIVAGLAERAIPHKNLGSALDFLGLILTGYSAKSEEAKGEPHLRRKCFNEAVRGYWSIRALALSPDNSYEMSSLVEEIVEILDLERPRE